MVANLTYNPQASVHDDLLSYIEHSPLYWSLSLVFDMNALINVGNLIINAS